MCFFRATPFFGQACGTFSVHHNHHRLQPTASQRAATTASTTATNNTVHHRDHSVHHNHRNRDHRLSAADSRINFHELEGAAAPSAHRNHRNRDHRVTHKSTASSASYEKASGIGDLLRPNLRDHCAQTLTDRVIRNYQL